MGIGCFSPKTELIKKAGVDVLTSKLDTLGHVHTRQASDAVLLHTGMTGAYILSGKILEFFYTKLM